MSADLSVISKPTHVTEATLDCIACLSYFGKGRPIQHLPAALDRIVHQRMKQMHQQSAMRVVKRTCCKPNLQPLSQCVRHRYTPSGSSLQTRMHRGTKEWWYGGSERACQGHADQRVLLLGIFDALAFFP
ncbi:hypothetical protein XAC3810_290003 [Xanthomonas citri pv. citri]|uniref:Uncharacterized protein n=1 Tax=Xanthomonas citri pv. citri TaxID=611301 RepID=A0A0U5FG31_XANCI|nr:hypothetical protein XAC9322_290003 [Xanthomonas citri pv. citri]CEE23442.1 hypothetical protein XAC3824_290003 [Xanthomonas citri pv. citri]CEE25024.1 hypothetical protein XAC1083_280003 [Xanthomonas citri pv. citri]CEE33598.1 hypothetical protein XAC3810_290003 [Xanthomonas citri pv. citri]CEE35949.1 hypothetical protein XAC902_340003 [Xanthomonas citri pv. citri]